ncbi:MAG TPA: DUF881 domain-containing protein, partial [Jiangellaceae bacterium]|nr:DUF881 domain-containing protein [Jiangellaceae bacterium]
GATCSVPEPTSPATSGPLAGPDSSAARDVPPEPIGRPAAELPRRFVPTAPTGLQRLSKALRARPDLGQVGVALLVGLLGFAAAVQVRADDEDLLNRARRGDLFLILDGLTARGDQLEEQIAALENDRRELLSGADSEQAALEQTTALARQLAVLAGTVEATGPGIVVTIADPEGEVDARTMYSSVQELRSAGAEAIELSGADDARVRVVASTYLIDDGDGIEVDGVHLLPPYRFTAIGDPETLAEAMEFPQGVVDAITGDGGVATVTQHDELVVDVVHEATPPQYASPAPDDSG